MGAIKLKSQIPEYGIPRSSFLMKSSHLSKRGVITPFPYESCKHTITGETLLQRHSNL